MCLISCLPGMPGISCLLDVYLSLKNLVWSLIAEDFWRWERNCRSSWVWGGGWGDRGQGGNKRRETLSSSLSFSLSKKWNQSPEGDGIKLNAWELTCRYCLRGMQTDRTSGPFCWLPGLMKLQNHRETSLLLTSKRKSHLVAVRNLWVQVL